MIKNEVLRVLRPFKDLTVFDVGCNDGLDTIWFKENLSVKQLHAFEMDSRNFDRHLNKVKDRFKDDPSVVINQIAIGDTVGEVKATLSTDTYWGHLDTGASSIKGIASDMYRVFPWIRFDETVSVPITTLDQYCEDNGIKDIDLIWADIQGAEREMVLGAQRILNKTRFMVLEVHSDAIYENSFTKPQQFLEILQGWSIVSVVGVDVLFQNNNLK